MIKRRSFIQALLGIPALAVLRPRVSQAQPHDGLIFSDSEGTDSGTLRVLADKNLTTGVSYGA